VSPRPKGRGTCLDALGGRAMLTLIPENVKGTLCRNVTIYGHCRYENKGTRLGHMYSRLELNLF
jgi:hypothetical protein